jgi:hypothetical protein
MEQNNTVMLIITAIAVILIIAYSIQSLRDYYKNMFIINDYAMSATQKPLIVLPGKREDSSIPIIVDGTGVAYSISTWIYLNPTNISKEINKDINIIKRGNFNLLMDIVKNELKLVIPVYSGPNEELVFPNFPIQRWVNITITVNNRKVDLWLNGKLYSSKQLNNLIANNQNDNLFFGPFNGQIARTYYHKYDLSRLEIVDIFDNGPYSTNFINKLWDRTKILIFGNMADTDKSGKQKTPSLMK